MAKAIFTTTPEAPEARPHPQFLRFHRQQVFKGASSAR